MLKDCASPVGLPESNVYLEVQVSLVPVIWPHAEGAEDLFTLLAGDVVLQVEDGLLPVGVGSLRGGGEAHALVAAGELDVEEGDEGLHVVVALDCQVEGRLEGDVVLGARLDVDLLQQARVGHHLVAVDHVHQRLLQRHVADAGHVEAVHVVPPAG